MALLVYKFSNYEHTAEREQYRNLCKQLKSYYSSRDEICLFIANYNIFDCELDGIIIKQDAIICVEFKNYGGQVTATDNGNWTLSDGTIIKGGSRKSVYQQAKLNHIAVRQGFADGGILPKKMLKDVAALVVFHNPITIVNRLSSKTQSWLHISDETTFMEKVQDITSTATDLTDSVILNLIDKLALSREYLEEEYSNVEMVDHTESVTDIDTSTTGSDEEGQEEETESTLDSQQGEDREESGLINHIKKVVDVLFKGIDSSIHVFKLADVKDLFASKGIQLTHQHLVSVEFSNAKAQTGKLSRFLAKEVKAINNNLVFWEEGEEIEHSDSTDNTTDVQPFAKKTKLNLRKSRTVLPHWLDRYIFESLNATYSPEHNRYEYNLDLSNDELKVYLGTYFPRSYAELFCIMDNLFHHADIRKIFQEKSSVRILDFGCGTGGELLGLLTALDKYITKPLDILISACDGSENALAILQQLVSRCAEKTRHMITLECRKRVVSVEHDLNGESLGTDFDFIICSKMACELLSHNVVKTNVYSKLASALCPLLNKDGMLILLDVTTKDEKQKYFYPQLMNHELNKFISDNKDYSTLLPLSCGCNSNCTEYCFMQQTFMVSHSHKANDESRVCYRIISSKHLQDKIIKHLPANADFVIHSQKHMQGDDSSLCVKGTRESSNVIDSFNINF